MYLKYLIFLLFSYSPSNCLPQGADLNAALNGKECKVIEQATGQAQSCKFPFIYKDKAYYGCTTVDGIDGKAWCSTKVDPLSMEHEEGGYRGNCPDPSEDSEYACKTHKEGWDQHEKFNEFQNSLEQTVARSPDEVIAACICEPYKTCKWGNDVVWEIAELPKRSPLWLKRGTFFQSRICDPRTRSVYCCGDDQTPPNDNEVMILKDPESFIVVKEKKNSGKWKPDGAEEECGTRTQLSNIVGGKRAKLGDFPYMALLGYQFFNSTDGRLIKSYDCGGSLINKWYVLTAAHCMFETSGNHDINRPSEVVLGELRIDTDPDCQKNDRGGENCAPPKITREITSDDQIIVHEGYEPGSSTQANDVALIRLNEPVPLYDEEPDISFAKPVCLPWKEDDPGRNLKENAKAVVTGWGKIKTSLKDLARKRKFGASARNLLYVKLPIANEICNKDPVLAPYWNPDTKVCAGGEKGKDACQGDSGGPLVIRDFADEPWYQIGLVSFGLESICGGRKNSDKKPGIFTKVVHYLPWIESKMQD